MSCNSTVLVTGAIDITGLVFLNHARIEFDGPSPVQKALYQSTPDDLLRRRLIIICALIGAPLFIWFSVLEFRLEHPDMVIANELGIATIAGYQTDFSATYALCPASTDVAMAEARQPDK